jgi:hypothetical protein
MKAQKGQETCPWAHSMLVAELRGSSGLLMPSPWPFPYVLLHVCHQACKAPFSLEQTGCDTSRGRRSLDCWTRGHRDHSGSLTFSRMSRVSHPSCLALSFLKADPETRSGGGALCERWPQGTQVRDEKGGSQSKLHHEGVTSLHTWAHSYLKRL